MYGLTPDQVAQLCREALPDARVTEWGILVRVVHGGQSMMIEDWYGLWTIVTDHGRYCEALNILEDLGMALCRLAQLPTPWSHLLADLRDQGVPDAPAALLGSPRALVACARRLSP